MCLAPLLWAFEVTACCPAEVMLNEAVCKSEPAYLQVLYS